MKSLTTKFRISNGKGLLVMRFVFISNLVVFTLLKEVMNSNLMHQLLIVY